MKQPNQVLISIMDENGNTDFRVVIPLTPREMIEEAIQVFLKKHFIDEVFDKLVIYGFIKDSDIETWGVNI